MRNIDNDTVFLYMQTYDVEEKCLVRMLESVQKQTYKNYICFLYDNCSKKESIHEILERYSLEDDRFQLRKIFESTGTVILWNYAIPEVIELSKGKGFFSVIDADDELEEDALEIMVSEIKNEQADMVCAGAYFVDAESGKIRGKRASEEKYIIEGKTFGDKFPNYYQLMRTHWAKMMRMSMVEKLRLNQLPKISYGKDTLLIREALFQSQRVVVIPRIVYRYFMYNNAKPYNIGPSRIESPRSLYLNDLHFLFQKVGYVSADNMNFLLYIYMMETKETILLVQKWTCSMKEKIDFLYPMLTNEENRTIYRALYGEVYSEFGEWIVSQEFCVDEETLKKTCEMLGVMGFVPGNLPQYNNGIFYRVLIEIDKFLTKSSLKKQLRSMLLKIASSNGICKGLDEYFLVKYSDLVIEVLNGSYEKALSLIKEYISRPYGYMELSKGELAELGLTLSSLLEKDNDFVYLKKYQIRHYIDTNIQKAKEELDDWRQILPEDTEIQELCNLVNMD